MNRLQPHRHFELAREEATELPAPPTDGESGVTLDDHLGSNGAASRAISA